MGCVRSKEDKGPASKYRPVNTNATPANANLGHYGPDPTLMGHSPAAKVHNNSYNSHAASLTPFGGASSVMAPFGGASTSYTSVAVSSPFPSVITGQCVCVCECVAAGVIRFQAHMPFTRSVSFSQGGSVCPRNFCCRCSLAYLILKTNV